MQRTGGKCNRILNIDVTKGNITLFDIVMYVCDKFYIAKTLSQFD